MKFLGNNLGLMCLPNFCWPLRAINIKGWLYIDFTCLSSTPKPILLLDLVRHRSRINSIISHISASNRPRSCGFSINLKLSEWLLLNWSHEIEVSILAFSGMLLLLRIRSDQFRSSSRILITPWCLLLIAISKQFFFSLFKTSIGTPFYFLKINPDQYV